MSHCEIMAEHHGGTVSALNLADTLAGSRFVVPVASGQLLGDRMGEVSAPVFGNRTLSQVRWALSMAGPSPSPYLLFLQ